MNIKAMDAANAYANVLKNQGAGGSGIDKIGSISPAGSAGSDGPGSFSELLKTTISDTADAVGKSEKIGLEALNGSADLVDVVTSVQNAEMVLDTVVAVRDKVIAAYQDIIKMPI
ncbi:flagellar hook-basal body complex protein FliE [Paremcibacter congregatus]|uniref:flagellar hook-basal body complex protein FliE n=1 Tax=Paremcibacter congregatus TaxID=2043170 RepID=UPI0030EE4035|tara:strand:- start:5127 stop:5471 length:345 start_codon:yes stop_codon:yes gene_type:complete